MPQPFSMPSASNDSAWGKTELCFAPKYNKVTGYRETTDVQEPDPERIVAFAKPEDLGRWLMAHNATETELWVKIFKKGTGIPSVTWEDVVIESLCWGWIDGVKKSLDDQAYLQRITPRTPRSNWSKRNTEHVERLINEGRMKESGLAQVLSAKADGRWKKPE